MKKLFFILITLLSISSCYKIWTDQPEWAVGSYRAQFSVGDSVFYYNTFNVWRNCTELYLVKKEVHTLYVKYYTFDNREYYVNKDSVAVKQEDYTYSPDEFIILLNDLNKIPREGSIFKITPEMYCSWELFDTLYNKYIIRK